MSDQFDPYHKWLGIPPSQQPPTHYRLLGIEAFESDREVIDAAANQRMAYLQDLAGGEHIAATQTLLNEVAAARRCLLNPAQKAAYDATLKSIKPASQQALPLDFSPPRFPAKKKAAATPTKPNRLMLYLAAGTAVAVLVAAGGIGAVLMSRSGKRDPEK